ncbi:NAD(P)H-hydrate dehydratase [Yoonia sp. MH D7]
MFEMTPALQAKLQKSGRRHKHSYGHAVIISGCFGNGGAARLAAGAALRVGAGLVSVVCDPDAVGEHASHLNAVMIKPFGGDLSLTKRLTDLRPSAICIGPNLGLDDAARGKLTGTLVQNCPICIDADAITLLSDQVFQPAQAGPTRNVMTPHEGELRRFIPKAFTQTTCRMTLAKIAAQKANCTVLFKGSDTVIATPDGRSVIVSSKDYRYASWLATAGSGDVLAGIITGLLARGVDAFDAAAMGADLHLRCADAFGPGLTSEDIAGMLPQVLRGLDDGAR